jgi:diguanylate cyclase (GGDEF)-like protein/PAS domain S-box-containing protein
MILQLSIFTLFYIAATLVASVTAILAWRRRSVPGGMWLFLMVMAAIAWTLADALDVSSVGLTSKILWGKMSYLGSATIDVFLLLFAFEYTHRAKWVTRRNVILLFAIPVLSILAAFTNDSHHLLWNDFTFTPENPIILIYHHGPLYWFFTAYIYATILLAAFLLVNFALNSRELYRYQSAVIITAILIPFTAELVYDFVPGFYPGLDISAVSLTLSGAFFTVNMLRWKLLDVIPVAREALVEQLQDGMIVLDEAERVVDLNLAARDLLEGGERAWIGQPASQLFALVRDYPGLEISATPAEFRLAGPLRRDIEVRVSGLYNQNHRVGGKLVIVRDITPRKQAEEALAASEAKFRTFFNVALDPILLLDENSRIIDCNPAAVSMLGADSRDQLIGQQRSNFSPERQLDGELSAIGTERVNQLMIAEGKAQFEWLYRRLDGTEFVADVSLTWIPMGEGKKQLVHLRDVTERKLVEEKLRELSLVDSLTGLNNRRAFMVLATQQLKTADRMGEGALLFFADLDGLKWINDHMGHGEGDRALVDTANILRNSFRASDIIARLGGDEFVGLGIETQENKAEVILARLQEHLNAHNLQESRPYKLSISFGIARYTPQHPCSLQELLEEGDKAMYVQKQAHKLSLKAASGEAVEGGQT